MKSNSNTEFDHLWKNLPLAFVYQNIINLFNASIPSPFNFFGPSTHDVLIAKEIINHLQNGYPHGKIKVILTYDVRDLYLYLLNVKTIHTSLEPTGIIARTLNYAIERIKALSIKYFSYSLDDDTNIPETFSEQLAILTVTQQRDFIALVTANNTKEMKQSLLKNVVDINELYAGGTPLHYAITYNYVEAANILIAHGADVNIPNLSGITALEAARGKDEFREIIGAPVANV